MSLRLIALDPDTRGDDCPAVFVDTATGDLVVQGKTVTGSAELVEVNAVSRMADDESAVRLPERMREVVLRALVEVAGEQPGAGSAR